LLSDTAQRAWRCRIRTTAAYCRMQDNIADRAKQRPTCSMNVCELGGPLPAVRTEFFRFKDYMHPIISPQETIVYQQLQLSR
jgi:hypothetical protein